MSHVKSITCQVQTNIIGKTLGRSTPTHGVNYSCWLDVFWVELCVESLLRPNPTYLWGIVFFFSRFQSTIIMHNIILLPSFSFVVQMCVQQMHHLYESNTFVCICPSGPIQQKAGTFIIKRAYKYMTCSIIYNVVLLQPESLNRM